MGIDLALHIALSGIAANQRALQQTSHNIANADTAGFTRKRVAVSSEEFQGHPMGVRAGEALRDVDLALLAERDGRGAAQAAAELRARILRPVEAMQGRPEDDISLGARVAALTEGFTALRDSPADPGLMRAALRRAEEAAMQFRDTAHAVQAARREAQDGIVGEVGRINDTLREMADLTRIIRAEVVTGRSTAELEDQRDVLLTRLSESLPVRGLRQPDGGIVLLARNGITLPLPARREDVFSTANAAPGPEAFYGPGGSLPGVMQGGIDVTRQLSGGRLAELLQLRDTILPRMQAELDVAAVELAGRFEAVGLRLFTDAAGVVPDRTAGHVAGGHVGFAARIRVNPGLPPNAMQLRDGTHATAGGPGQPTAFAPNPPGGPAGFTTLLDRVLDHALGGTAAPGEPWSAFPLNGLGPLGDLGSAIAYPRDVADFANQAVRLHTEARSEASAAAEAAGRMRDGMEARIRDRSGVNTDEEMAMLMRLQNAYAANARVMSTAQGMWDALLGAVR